jgi:hypothetical protein
MYPRSSFEHSSRPTFPPQPLPEFRFGSHHHIASPLSTPLPIPYHFRTAPYHSRTKSFSPYLTSSKSLARLYQKTPRVRTLSSISARSKLRTAPRPVILSGVTRPFSSSAAFGRGRGTQSNESPFDLNLVPDPIRAVIPIAVDRDNIAAGYKPLARSSRNHQVRTREASRHVFLPLLVHSSCTKLFQGNRLT